MLAESQASTLLLQDEPLNAYRLLSLIASFHAIGKTVIGIHFV
jgi:hypothetical protein